MKDRYFTALADEQRRDLLLAVLNETRYQVENQEQTPLEEEIRLTHVHLPLLEDAKLIQWDRDTHSITRGSNYEELKPLIEILEAQQPVVSD